MPVKAVQYDGIRLHDSGGGAASKYTLYSNIRVRGSNHIQTGLTPYSNHTANHNQTGFTLHSNRTANHIQTGFTPYSNHQQTGFRPYSNHTANQIQTGFTPYSNHTTNWIHTVLKPYGKPYSNRIDSDRTQAIRQTIFKQDSHRT